VWKCKRCGFSRVMSLLMKWDSNGTTPMFAKVLKYRPGKTCDILVKNPYNQALLAGNKAGIFEAMEGGESEVTWEIPSHPVSPSP
jgi:hypothetical protein